MLSRKIPLSKEINYSIILIMIKMIDFLKIEGVISDVIGYESEPIMRFDTVFIPRYNDLGIYIEHRASINGLLVKLRYDRITITNSLHKYWKGNNYSDFTHSDITSSIERLEDLFKIRSENLQLRRIETGVNVEFNTVSLAHTLFSSYKKNDFYPMRKGNKVYGRKCSLTEFELKAYYKKTEIILHNPSEPPSSNISDNLFRVEMPMLKMRPIKGVVSKLSDLKNRESLKYLGNRMIKYFEKIEMTKDYDYSSLSANRIGLFFAGINNDYWKQLNIHTRKKNRTEYLRIRKQLDKLLEDDTQKHLIELIRDKVNYLVYN